MRYSCPLLLPHSHGASPMSLPCIVHELQHIYYHTSFAYSRRLSQVPLDIVNRSDTINDVHFPLTVTIQKIADRWVWFLSLWAAFPMVVSLIGYGAYCGDTNELCHSFRRSLVPIIVIVKYGAHIQAPYKFSHPDGRSWCFYSGSFPLQSPDSNPGPLDPRLSPLPMSPRRLQGLVCQSLGWFRSLAFSPCFPLLFPKSLPLHMEPIVLFIIASWNCTCR